MTPVLNSEPDLLQSTEIEYELARLGLSEHLLLYREETQSTNTDVIKHYEQTRQLSIATCEMQTAGKGRRGRHWISPYARNIYCTVGMTKTLPASHLGLLSIVSGIALCRALASSDIDAVRLKWPNDLVFDNNNQKQKLGGILIESRPVANGYFLAIGFGLNVHMTQEELDAIPQAATSLSLISEKKLKRQTILLAAIKVLTEAIHRFNESMIEPLMNEFAQYDAYSNQQVSVLYADDKIIGFNKGINTDGQLLLDTDQGVLSFSAAEISLRSII